MTTQTPRTASFPVRSNSWEQYGYLRQSHEELELDLAATARQNGNLLASLAAANEKLARLRELAKVLVMAAYSKDEDACTIALRALRAELGEE